MKHPAYTLLKSKKHTGMEGPGFRAFLARKADNKILAEVYNGGDGGPTIIRPMDPEGYKGFAQYVASMKITFDLFGNGNVTEITTGKDQCIIEEILDDLEWQKKLERAAKTAVLFRLETDPEDAVRKVPLKGHSRESVIAWVNGKYPKAKILA
jgi:hypothetical protein